MGFVPTSHADILSQNDTFISEKSRSCGLDIPAIVNGSDPHKYIVIRGYCGILQHFVHSPTLTRWLVSVGVLPSRLEPPRRALERTHWISQFLLVDVIVPHPSLWDTVVRFKEQVRWSEMKVVGMHVRTGLLEGNVGWGRFLEKEDVELFYEEAMSFTRRLQLKGPVRWLVLVDNEEVKQELKEKAGDYYLSTGLMVAHSKEGVAQGIENSLIDNYLLSECDALVLTSQSTYGYLAKHRTDVPTVNIGPGLYRKYYGWCVCGRQDSSDCFLLGVTEIT